MPPVGSSLLHPTPPPGPPPVRRGEAGRGVCRLSRRPPKLQTPLPTSPAQTGERGSQGGPGVAPPSAAANSSPSRSSSPSPSPSSSPPPPPPPPPPFLPF